MMPKLKNTLMRLLPILTLLLLISLLPSCSLNKPQSDLGYSQAALYDPPAVHLIEGQEYQFVEGKLMGRKNHIFYSEPTYRRGLKLGEESQWKPISK